MTETVVTERTYDATPEAVFSAWTEVELLSQWFGCAEDMLWKIHAWNPVVGGEIHVSLDFDGEPYEVRGQFLEVDAPRRLRYSWEGGQVVTVTIESRGAQSHLRVEHAGLPTEEMGGIVTGGWSASVEQLRGALT